MACGSAQAPVNGVNRTGPNNFSARALLAGFVDNAVGNVNGQVVQAGYQPTAGPGGSIYAGNPRFFQGGRRGVTATLRMRGSILRPTPKSAS
jgi:hypothetical protein